MCKIKNNKILINRIFNGSYNNDNIGHEFINLLNPDNSNERYLYICPYGYFSKKEYSNPKYIIFCKTINSKKLRILGISTKHELKHNIFSKNAISEEIYKNQCNTKLRYLGIPLENFFKDEVPTILYTFASLRFYKPKKNIYLVPKGSENSSNILEDDIYIPIEPNSDGSIKCSKQYQYYDNESICQQIKKVLKDFVLDNNNSNKSLKNKDGTYKEQYKKSFLDTIKKTDDENIFSNWLASILNSNENLCSDFIKEILKYYNKTYKTSHTFDKNNNLIKIVREYSTKSTIKSDNNTKEYTSIQTENEKYNAKRIDLWIETDKYIIYIENKIKSGINGYTEKKHDWQEEEIKSQLSNYYTYAQNYNKSNYNSQKTIIPIILAPNYSEIFKNSHLLNFDNYCKMTYKDLFDCLVRYKNKAFPSQIYFGEFLNAIDRHTKGEPLSVYEEIYQKVIDFTTK